MKKIIVIGSISIDNVIYTKNLPQPGVTVHGESFITNLGGKGANQACAIKFLGGDVVFYGAIGDDDHGEYVQKHLKNVGLTAFLKKSKHQTGIACILWREKAERDQRELYSGDRPDGPGCPENPSALPEESHHVRRTLPRG